MTKKIMIVDDSPVEHAKLGSLLRDNGYDVRMASGGKEALDLVMSFAPDIILLDIVMPDMDGYETCRRLKANGKTKAIPVWFVSSKSQKADVCGRRCRAPKG